MRYFKNIIFYLLFVNIYVLAQFDPHPELDWYTIETEHFYIHYHDGAERTANTVAKIAEEIYGPMTSLYNYRPSDKTSFIINDQYDYGNGATDYYGNRIEIYATTLDIDFRLRGTHNWLRNVITHEFTHAVQVQSAMKFTRKMPGIYLQWLNYEDERRPDVLYGYPNVIASYPISGVNVPAWFAEGTAQYQRQQMGYDNWDSHRDMMLRMMTLGNNLLTWEEMGSFASATTYTAESIYSHGFGLIRYIAWKYGEDKLKEISDNMGDIFTFNSESAFRKAIGKSGKELYNEWKQYLIKDYNDRIADVKNNKIEGDIIGKTGFFNYYPQFSPDGKKLTYLSNKTSDYGGTSLFIMEVGNVKSEKPLITGVPVNYSWSPDGKKILFSRRSTINIHGRRVFDIYEYDLNKEEETRITEDQRVHSPSYSPDGKNIAFIKISDGTQNIYTGQIKDDKLINQKNLTNFKNGEQVYNPKWSPDGKTIVCDFSLQPYRKILVVNTDPGQYNFILAKDSVDFRDPVYSKDGKTLYFTSDVTGIYNIYSINLKADYTSIEGRVNSAKQITNSIGGAFMPSIDSANNIAFSTFQSTGYKVNLLKSFSIMDSASALSSHYKKPDRLIQKYVNENASNSSNPKNKYDWDSLKSFRDVDVKIRNKSSYNNVSTPLSFIPVLRIDNYSKTGNFADAIKPGLYFYSSDVMGRMGIFGGASLNRKLERDLFLQFDYNEGLPFGRDLFIKKLGFVPKFNLGLYNVTRKTEAELELSSQEFMNVDVTYDLFQFEGLMNFNIINAAHQLQAGFTFSKYSSSLNTFFIPGVGQIPSTSTNYFTGRNLSLLYTYQVFEPNRNEDINPIGTYVKLKYDYEFSDLNPTLVINEQGNLIEEFEKAKFHRLEGDILKTFSIFNTHSLSFRVRGGSILGPDQDNFFDFYATGFPGMKGYPFYALGGNEYFTANVSYRFPLFTNIDWKFMQFYFDKIYLGVYGDVGNAWNGKATQLKDFKRDVGLELRLQAFSWYVYPTSFAFNAAYGLDKFSREFPSSREEDRIVDYGKEWRFYFTLLFGFDFLNSAKNLKF